MQLTEAQAFVVRNLYGAALIPLLGVVVLTLLGKLPRWVALG